MNEILEKIRKSISMFKIPDFDAALDEAIRTGIGTDQILKTLTQSANEIRDAYERREAGLPQLLVASHMFGRGFERIKPLMPTLKPRGKVVLGTVWKDLHDIGKNLVKAMLEHEGYEVIDLGKDVPPSVFAQKAKDLGADIVGSSAMMTTTMKYQKEIEEELRKIGIREKVKTVVGGAPLSSKWAEFVGANAYSSDCVDAVRVVNKLIEGQHE